MGSFKDMLAEDKAIVGGWKRFFFSWKGRISRRHFWLYWILPDNIFWLFLNITLSDSIVVNAINLLFALVMIWPSICLTTKRLHDRGRSGWWQLWVVLIALVGIGAAAFTAYTGLIVMAVVIGIAPVAVFFWIWIEILFLPSDPMTNQFGAPPFANKNPENVITPEGTTDANILENKIKSEAVTPSPTLSETDNDGK